MKDRLTTWALAAALFSTLALVACDGGDPVGVDARDAGEPTDPGASPDGVAANGEMSPDGIPTPERPPPPGATRYALRIENVAGAALPTALSAGVWTTHADADPLFTEGAPDRGEGLEALAEDGDPSALAASLDPDRSGTFRTPVGAAAPAPLSPGQVYETVVFFTGDAHRLSFATSLSESNDVFLAPTGAGIDLRRVTAETDVTDQLRLWNAGTEDDEAPGLGPHQAARQSAPNRGSPEGVIRQWESGTRTLPLAFDVLEVDVTEADGVYTLRFRNVSAERGAFVTAVSPLFWALHSDAYRIFTEGAAPPDNGLASLAEIADARPLSEDAAGAPGVVASGVSHAGTGTGLTGLARPGQTLTVEVSPDAAHPFLSVAAMLLGTNDAFLGFPGEGLRLIEPDGTPRSASAVQRDARRSLAIWDAGVERNEVPGAGWHQGPAGGLDDTADDPDRTVRRYDDATNDLAGPVAGGLLGITITRQGGRTFEIRVVNHSDRLPFQVLLTPFVWVVHDERPALFDLRAPQSPGLESLGEDCLTNTLYREARVTEGVLASGVNGTALAPNYPGEVFTFEVTADREHRFFNMISMPYPSNDMLVAFEPPGVPLLEPGGGPRSDAAIAADVARLFHAWDTGTEANEAGGGGLHNVPSQNDLGMQDWGPSEGDGTVRAEPDPAFSYPAVDELVRVTLRPIRG